MSVHEGGTVEVNAANGDWSCIVADTHTEKHYLHLEGFSYAISS